MVLLALGTDRLVASAIVSVPCTVSQGTGRDFAALAFGAALLLVSLFVTIRYGRFYNPFV